MLDGYDSVSDSEREIVVRMHPLARFRIQDVAKGFKTVGYLMHQESARGIHDIDAVRAIRFH